ncbi:hypothetical protein JOB18_045859 [Solea senegalensis]|uniref:Uncharacterized protein n=1 Tax=Solea senegalensis TaxID=28829 RepID=A0AAV6QEP5_SOLSE|nr:hypothetical protein JOB18_045859 [Solea senegalensis]
MSCFGGKHDILHTFIPPSSPFISSPLGLAALLSDGEMQEITAGFRPTDSTALQCLPPPQILGNTSETTIQPMTAQLQHSCLFVVIETQSKPVITLAASI